VGTAIADLNVCGAVAPYNELLTGKLVAMLAATPEVVDEYKKRYAGSASWIASSMAGKPVVRSADLVFVGTTSLYGTRPSQYDRVAFPAILAGGKKDVSVRYRFLDNTAGIGTAQFSLATKNAIAKYLRQDGNDELRVNNVFGEGANPKLRLLREGLSALGIMGESSSKDNESLLMHGMSKAVYAVWLVENLRDYLLGLDKRAHYIYKRTKSKEATARIRQWWLRRWVGPRLERPEVLDRIAANSLVRPIRHGARVVLPEVDVAQLSLM
jgi:hypothetical protein